MNAVQRTPFGVFNSVQPCPQCQGKGQEVEEYCGSCKGKGIVVIVVLCICTIYIYILYTYTVILNTRYASPNIASTANINLNYREG